MLEKGIYENIINENFITIKSLCNTIIEKNIDEMLHECVKLLSDKGFLVLNLYSMGLSALLARTALRQTFGTTGHEEFGELYFKDRFDKELPLGPFCRFTRQK